MIGCGLVGQIVCRLARCAGAEVYALDVDPARIHDAAAGGADHGINADAKARRRILSLTRGVGVDHAIVTAASGSNAPLVLGAEILRDRGALTLVGDLVPVEMPGHLFIARSLDLPVSQVLRNPDATTVSTRSAAWTIDSDTSGGVRTAKYGGGARSPGAGAPVSVSIWGRRGRAVEHAPRAYERLTEQRLSGRAGRRPSVQPSDLRPSTNAWPGSARARRRGRPRRALPGQRSGSSVAENFAREVLIPAFRGAGACLEVVGGGSGRLPKRRCASLVSTGRRPARKT